MKGLKLTIPQKGALIGLLYATDISPIGNKAGIWLMWPHDSTKEYLDCINHWLASSTVTVLVRKGLVKDKRLTPEGTEIAQKLDTLARIADATNPAAKAAAIIEAVLNE